LKYAFQAKSSIGIFLFFIRFQAENSSKRYFQPHIFDKNNKTPRRARRTEEVRQGFFFVPYCFFSYMVI